MKNNAPNTILFAFIMLLSVTTSRAQEIKNTEVEVNKFITGTLTTSGNTTKTLAIIIAGSGPTDRNGNSQLTRNDSYKLLAEGIVKEGIAVYRYDKRVVTMIRNRMSKMLEMSFDDVIADAVSIIQHFKEEGHYDTIYLVGHSQGSLVAMVAAQQEDVSGVISIAGAGQPIDNVIIDQVSAQMPALEQDLKDGFTTLRSEGKLDTYKPVLASIFNKETQPYMLSWMKYNPSEEIKNVNVPTMIINGTRDFQVNTEEAQMLSNARPEAPLEIIKDMNHVLRLINTDDLLINQKSYQEPKTPISEELVSKIVAFINKNS